MVGSPSLAPESPLSSFYFGCPREKWSRIRSAAEAYRVLAAKSQDILKMPAINGEKI